MKNRIFTIVAVIIILSACENSLSPTPVIPREGGTSSKISPPGNFTASHGNKRSIYLSWDEVSGAVRYNIARADYPFDTFTQCAETTETQFNFPVPPGRTIYYRISSIARNGEESAQSAYVMGSSLAQPLITDITDVTESSSTVTWYMDNASDKTYKASLRYTVYCLVKGEGTEVAQLALDGSQITENKALFTGLLAGKEYTYQVEAYLVNDQSNSEKSEIMDKETARRFRPGAPEKLMASHGIATNKIELSFDLPEMVNIALNAGEYELHGLYFVIFRKFGNTEYLKVCSYFGSANETGPNAADTSSKYTFPGNYDFGKTVTWTDTNVARGVEYEYLVQSYVDGTLKTISSDESKAEAKGWALAQGTASLGTPVYIPNVDASLYVSAELPLNVEFDSKGEEYRYKVLETINPIGDAEENDPVGEIKRESMYLTWEQIKNYRATMNLTKKSNSDSPGRGLYSYQVKIFLSGGTPIDTLTAVGDVQIIEDIYPIIVEGFYVQDGYTDKFRIKWDYYSSRKYILLESADGITWNEVKVYNPTPVANENVPLDMKTETVLISELSCYSPDKPIYFAMQPIKKVLVGFNTIDKKGQRVYSDDCRTLGVPKQLSVDGHSYSTLTAAWDEAQKADTYRIKYKYTTDGSWQTAGTVSRGQLSLDAYNQLKYSFKPEGNTIDIAKAGETIQVQIEALNKGLQAIVYGETGNDGGEIATTSTAAESQLVGPAKLAPQASRAASAENIAVSWNKVAGADGYYVFRRQFNMDNTAEKGSETVVYYIPAQTQPAISITGKNLWLDNDNSRVDTAEKVKAHAGFISGRYQLTDTYLSDYPKNNISSNDEYNGSFSRSIPAYKDQQNELAWGYSYRYYVVPVVSRNGISEALDSIEFKYDKDFNNANTGINSFSIRENGVTIGYSGAAAPEQTGFTIGFGQNVTATKGTYASSGNVNNGVKITWSLPPLLAAVSGFSPRYTVYRRNSGGSTWEIVTTNVSTSECIDTLAEGRGIAYEYAIGITNGSLGGGSDPRYSKRFIDLCYTQYDDKGRPKMLGFMLDMVKMDSVSRNEQKAGNDFAEEVKWKSAGIKNSFNTDNNWGIDGYTVFVMNRNIDANWHEIANIPYNNIPNQLQQSVKVTNVKSGDTLEAGLLKVLRDYKHFFKVRSYVLNNDEKIYCPDPTWTYQYRFGTTEAAHIAASDAMQDDYVKWGARQVTKDEFIKIAAVYIARGIVDSWADLSNKTSNASTTWGGSGKVDGTYSYQAATDSNRSYTYTNYKVDLQNRTGQWITFVTINGKIWARSYPIGSYPFRYGEDGWVTIKGPWDTPDLYTGQIVFGANRSQVGASSGANNGGFSWNGNGTTAGGTNTSDGGENGTITARIAVKYPGTVANPGAAAEEQLAYRGSQTPLQFKDKGDNRYQLDEWK